MDGLPMDGLPMHPEDATNIATTFFKCTRWQIEETTGLSSCRYHYFCASTYPGDYPSIVDIFVILLTLTSYLSTFMFMTMKFINRDTFRIRNSKRRLFVPSGPLLLPLILLILSWGQRINTIFPLSSTGPALLHLVYVSALAFESHSAVLEASTVSGILHASLYIDSIILPYYTGLEAMTDSRFSGECESCVCRNDALVAGGMRISYRGWSKTMVSVVCAICARMLFRIFEGGRWRLLIERVLEGMSWVLIARDSIYLMINLPHEIVLNRVVYGGICVLIVHIVFRELCGMLGRVAKNDQIQKIDLCYNNV